MYDNAEKRNIITKKALSMGIIAIAVCIIIFITAMFGEDQVKYLHGVLAIIVLICGIVNTSVKKEKDLKKIGIKLIWAGWILLPISAAGFLLAMSEYYTKGLGGKAWLMTLGYLITTILGLYELFYSNKELGTPLAP